MKRNFEKAKQSPFTQSNKALKNSTDLEIIDKELTVTQAKHLLPENLRHLNLNNREIKFLSAYLSNGFDAENATKIAGYKSRNKAGYKAIAYSLLHRKDIVSAIKIYVDTVIQPYKDRLELELLNIYYKRAFYSIDIFYNDNGIFKPLNEINKDYLCCIDDVEYVKLKKDIAVKYKLPQRDLALQALYKFITGEEIQQNSMLPDDAKRKMINIYNQIVKINDIKPKKVKKMTRIIENDD